MGFTGTGCYMKLLMVYFAKLEGILCVRFMVILKEVMGSVKENA